MTDRIIKYRVKQKLTLLEAPAGQPLHLEVEFRAEPAENLLRLRLIALQEKRRQNPLAPGTVFRIVGAKILAHSGTKTGAKIAKKRAQLFPAQLGVIGASKLRRTELLLVDGKEIQFRMA